MMAKTLERMAHASDARTVMVLKYDDEWEEYTVTPVTNGKADKKARYHTTDETDARCTMVVMARDYKPR